MTDEHPHIIMVGMQTVDWGEAETLIDCSSCAWEMRIVGEDDGKTLAEIQADHDAWVSPEPPKPMVLIGRGDTGWNVSNVGHVDAYVTVSAVGILYPSDATPEAYHVPVNAQLFIPFSAGSEGS